MYNNCTYVPLSIDTFSSSLSVGAGEILGDSEVSKSLLIII